MDSKDRDIYELLNNVNFDFTSENEVELNEMSMKRIKNNVLNKIAEEKSKNLSFPRGEKVSKANIKNRDEKISKVNKKSFWQNKRIIVAAIVALIITAMITPIGSQVIASIKNMFFFNPGLGLVNNNEEVYILNEPMNLSINGEELLVKSISSTKNGIDIGIWMGDSIKKKLGIKASSSRGKNILNDTELKDQETIIKSLAKINTKDGKFIDVKNYSLAGGGENSFLNLSFPTEELINEFTLIFNNQEIEIKLVSAENRENYDDVGGNDTDKNILIGANKYVMGGKTYLSFWSDEEVKEGGAYYIGFNRDDIRVFDKDKNILDISPSSLDGRGREFLVKGDNLEKLDVNVSKLELEYYLKNPVSMKLKIPSKGQSIEINDDIYIEELNEKILLKSISRNDDGIEITFRKHNKNEEINMLSTGTRGWAIGAGDDIDMKLGVYYEDLKLSEKISGKMNLEIAKVLVFKEGSWDINVR